MSTDADRGRWDGEVIGADTHTFEYRDREFTIRLQQFREGGTHMELLADAERPEWWRELLEFIREGEESTTQRCLLRMLADLWDLPEREVDL